VEPFKVRDDDGVLQWFPTPPLFVVDNSKPKHSETYKKFIKKQKSPNKPKTQAPKKKVVESAVDVEMEVDQPEGNEDDLNEALLGI
jgi:hypothetical protein